MQINPKYQNNPAFNKALLAHSEVTSAKKSSALGINTKSCSTLATHSFQKISDVDKRSSFRAFNIKLKERAGQILYDPKKSYKEQNRVCRCGTSRIHKNEPVGVKYNPDSGTASYTNLQYCSSVWLCPDCSYKISQERKKELAEAMIACRSKGLQVLMLTLTVPHYFGDDLKLLLKKMSKAKHAFWTNRNSRDYMNGKINKKGVVKETPHFDLLGHITATEVKYSEKNGFHPHYHILCFTERKFMQEDVDLIQDQLYEFWAEKCVKQGLGEPSKKHGLHIKIGSNEDVLADYVTKWGMAQEMTQDHQKIGKKNLSSLTMWEVLELSQMDASTKDKYSYIFKTYANGFKGRRQLFWSKELKELLKIEVKEDDEIANQEEEKTESFEALFLGSQDWWAICYHKKRAEFLELVEFDFRENGIQTNLKSVRDFLVGLKKPQGFSGVEGRIPIAQGII
jgi:hypothetical protein